MTRASRPALAGALLLLPALVLLPARAFAHSAVFDCFDEQDGNVTCEGGFSDGASASGVPVKVLDTSDKLLVSGVIDKDGRFAFKRPPGDFRVVFDAGKGHSVALLGSDITD